MSEGKRYRDLSDDALEDLIRGLPRRAPSAALRSRILSSARARQPCRPVALHRAWAPLALGLLLLADFLVLTQETARLEVSRRGTPPVISAHARPAEDEGTAWLADLGARGGMQRVALLRVEAKSARQDYATLLRELLNGAEGS